MKLKQTALPMVSRTDSFKIYLQVQLSGGFWDTLETCTEEDYREVESKWEEIAIEWMKKGEGKVRLLGIRIERIEGITELSLTE
jgi:hypothetical protein